MDPWIRGFLVVSLLLRFLALDFPLASLYRDRWEAFDTLGNHWLVPRRLPCVSLRDMVGMLMAVVVVVVVSTINLCLMSHQSAPPSSSTETKIFGKTTVKCCLPITLHLHTLAL